MRNARNRLGLMGLLVLVALGIAMLLTMVPAGASQTGDTYPAPGYHGDWTIDNPTRVIDEELYIDGNIIVNSQLELWNATIWFDNVDDDHYLNVTTNGNLKANDTLIRSAWSSYEYAFTVYGQMTLKRTTIADTYDGVRVLTDKTVLMEDSNFLRSYGTGLYLEDADGTTLKNIQIQTNDLRSTASLSAVSYSSTDYRQTKAVSADGGALYVKGGNPTIEDVYVSANGSISVTVDMDKYGYYYFYMWLHVYFPIVGIDSDEMTTVSGIHVRDSKVDIKVHYDCTDHWTYSWAYWYLYTYGYATAVNVINYGDVEVKDCTASNVVLNRVSRTYSVSSTGSAVYNYVYGSTTNEGSVLFGATINKEFTTAGPHKFKLTLRDATFEDIKVLATALTPNYNGSVDPTFISDVIIDNVSINKGSYPYSFNVGPQFAGMKTVYNNVRISNSTFTNMTGPLFTASADAGPGATANVHSFDYYEHLLVENNLFRWNKWGTYGAIYIPSQYKSEYNNLYDRHPHVRANKFLDNTGCLGYIWGNSYSTRGSERFTFEDNLVMNNTHTSYWMYMYYRDYLRIHNNKFIDNQWATSARFYDMGGDYNGKKPVDWAITDNVFEDTYVTSGGKETGLFYCQWGGDLNISGNNITGMESGFLQTYPYTQYAGYSDLYFTNNEWTDVNGTLIYLQNYYRYNEDFTAYIDDNQAWNSNGMIIDFYSYYAENYDGDHTTYFRNNTISGLTGTVFRNYGKNIISDNTFTDCTGYVIQLEYLSKNAPRIFGNNIVNCEDVYYIGAKDRGVLKMTLSVSDLNVDCTGNAFYFKNVDVTMDNVQITQNVHTAIIADSSNVDAMGSTIPIGSGLVVGAGEINVWFEFELWVEWSNKEDPDTSSGVPVTDGLVVLYGGSQAYYTSSYTDGEGHLATVMLPQWTLRGSFLTVWTPFSVSVAKSGVTVTHTFPLDKDYSGDDALHLLLSDTYIPDIRITTPFEGDTFNTESIVMHGFSTEVGSGIDIIEVAIGDGEWVEVVVDDNGDFFHTFSDLPEGEDIAIKARVMDIALNSNETSVMVTIDRTPPRLVVIAPEDGAIFNVAAITIVGEYEPGSSITINGLEKTGTSGILDEDYTLSEGRNTIVVVATDAAGNQAMVTRTVRLDRFAPTLTVLAPRNNLVTSVTKTMVEGDVEIGADITVTVKRSETDTIDEPITPADDGTFSHEVDLEEGANEIIVTAVDDAGNVAQVTRMVYVDTTAPMCTITSPKDGAITNENTVHVLGTADSVAVTLYLNGKQIHNSGTIDRVVNLNEGDNVIELRAVDIIGNEYSDRVTITLDTVPPVIEMSTPTATSIMTNEAELRFIGEVQGHPTSLTIMGVDVSLADEGEGVFSFDTTITMPKLGINDVLLVARDRATNVATHSISVDYSTEKPNLFITYKPTTSEIKGENPNFYITGLTTPGIASVKVTHTVGSRIETAMAPVAADGSFSIARTLSDGDNTFMVEVTDAYGNVNATADHTVSYTYQKRDTEGPSPTTLDPAALSLWILAIALALFLTVFIVTRMMKRD